MNILLLPDYRQKKGNLMKNIALFIMIVGAAGVVSELYAYRVEFFNHSYSNAATCAVRYRSHTEKGVASGDTVPAPDYVNVPVASGSNPGHAVVETSGWIPVEVMCKYKELLGTTNYESIPYAVAWKTWLVEVDADANKDAQVTVH